MAGGLIQIASYGLHDIFLIGNPQITFFKIVYRRHTNFAMEYIQEGMIGTQNFGGYLSCNLSKAGDLLHKLYLKIDLPQVAINKATYGIADLNTYNHYNTYSSYYVSIQNFINQVNFNLLQPLYTLLKINGLKYNDIKNKYNTSYNKMNYSNVLNSINNILWDFKKTFKVTLSNGTSNIIYINQQTPLVNFLDFNVYYKKYIKQNSPNIVRDLTYLLNNYVLQLNIIKKQMCDELHTYKQLNDTMMRTNIDFSWVNYIGNQIINKFEIEIGGKVIDFTDAGRMNIQYQLTNKMEHDRTYNIIIGNVEELTTFNSNTKPTYSLYIPIDFWFSKYSGLSIPLIYLRYHDVKINVQLNDLVNCCYYEKLNDSAFIEDIVKLDSVSLISNYVYLDSDERKKFAQLNHEYLIDQTQFAEFSNTTQTINVELPFFNLIKQLFWIIRDQANIDRLIYFDYGNNYYADIYSFDLSLEPISNAQLRNYVKIRTTSIDIGLYIKIGDTIQICNSVYYSGIYIVQKISNEYIYIYCDYFMKETYISNYTVINNSNGELNYSKNSDYMGNSQAFIRKNGNSNPFVYSTLELNGIQRFYKTDGVYNNFVQPYQNNSKAPNYGLNSFSFALTPEEYQPSGFCNFNALDLKSMTFNLNSSYQNKDLKKDLKLGIYCHGYNILKFAYGKAGIILNI